MGRDYYELRQRIRGKYPRIGDFAKALGMAKGTLSRKLQGRSEWDREEMVQVAELLGFTPDEILYHFF